ncbi:MAG: pyridoxamine 5'-phosphate oxidase family protein [Gemmatimonas sp.]
MRSKCIAAALSVFALCGTLSAQVPAKPAPTRLEVITAARSVIDKARFATLVTLGEKGEPKARIVDPFAPDSVFTVWVATNPATRKVGEIARDGRVVLLWFEPGNPGYVSLSGDAVAVSDPQEKEKHWKEDWKGLYSDRNHGSDYLLIRIKPTHMEVVSYATGIMNDPKTWRPVMIDFPAHP